MKTAPWHVVSDAFVMLAAPVSVNVVVAPAARLRLRFVWFVNATPVEVLQAASVSVSAEAVVAFE